MINVFVHGKSYQRRATPSKRAAVGLCAIACVLSTGLPETSVAEQVQFTVTADGICADSGSAALGAGTFILDTEAGVVEYSFSISGMTPVAIHVHGPSGNCNEAPDADIVAGFNAGTEQSGSYPVTPEQQDDMFAGRHWLNVHSLTVPRGEIRGKLALETHASNAKNRYLSFVPDSPGVETAWQVTLVDSEQFPGAVGATWWLGEPAEYCENGAEITPPCTPVAGIPSSTFTSSSLQCDQHCMDWGSLERLVYVGDVNIVPGASYEIRGIPCGCDPAEPTCYADPISLLTSAWGDTISTCEGCPCGGPTGGVDIIDCKAVIDKFVSAACAPLKSRVDLEPAVPDRQINITDALACIRGFQGLEYDLSVPVGCE